MAKLNLRGEGETEREVVLDDLGSVTIGRSPDCDIPIADHQASRRHCSVVKLQSGWEVADLGSTNGTLVNSTLTKKKKLRHGDVIRIGHAELVFHDPDSVGASEGSGENCFLVYAKGEHKGEKIELTQQRTTIGRKETNTVPLQDPVASSYHCEIVRDLNGYTIRDLGSTNGTLVNNEMVTEAQLVHGARVRIGNSRFVFQDPAMAEVDLETAGLDEEEQEWGMMRELDLAAVRKRNPATIVYTVLLLLLLGGGYAMTKLEPPRIHTGPPSPPNNMLDDWSFESESSAFAWVGESDGEVEVTTTTARKVSGKACLQVDVGGTGAEVFYDETFGGRGRSYEVQARLSTTGGATARIGLLWTGSGIHYWTLSDPVTGGGFTEASITRSAPPWANTVRLGLVIEGAGKAYMDDIVMRSTAGRAPVVVEQNDFRITITDGEEIDIAHAGIPILAKGRLLARDDTGAALAAPDLRIEVQAADESHLTVKITGAPENAALVGLEMEEVAGFLTSRGGFRAFGETDATFPDEGSAAFPGVRKMLLGPPGSAFSMLPATDDGTVVAEAEVIGRRRLARVMGTPVDGTFEFRLKTDLRGEAAEANRRMSEALTLYEKNRWGDYARAAWNTLAEFPFAPKPMQRQLQERLQKIVAEYSSLTEEAEQSLRDYDEFRDVQSLERVSEILKVLRGKFQVQEGEGNRGEALERMSKELADRLGEARRRMQGERAKPFFEYAQYVFLPEGKVYSAAVLLYHIVENLPASPESEQAKAELAKIEADHPQIREVLESILNRES